MAARLEIEIGGSDKGGNSELKETIGLLEELMALRKGLNIELIKAEDVQQMRAVGETLTAVNVRIGDYLNLATKATQAWRDNKTEVILDNLATKLSVLQVNTQAFGETVQNQSAQLRAYQAAFDQLVANGVSRTNEEMVSLETNIRSLTSSLATQKAVVAEQKVYEDLSDKLKLIFHNTSLAGDAQKQGEAKVRAYQSAINALLKLGLDPYSTKVQSLKSQIVALNEAMGKDPTGRLRENFQKTGSLILDLENKITRLKQNVTFAKSEKDVERYNRRIADATKELQRLQTVGTGAAQAMARVGSQTSQAGIEFSRIVQDAPYAAQNIGSIGNNITRVAELWPQYIANARAAVVANGQVATSANVLKAALAGLVGGWNGIILAISAVVTAFTIWQQVSQKRARDAEKDKKAEEDYTQVLQKRIKTMGAVAQAQAAGASDAVTEITRLNLLRSAIENELVSRDNRLGAIKALKSQYPEYFKNLSNEKILAGEVADVYAKLSTQLMKTALAQAAVKKAIELGQKVLDTESITFDNLEKIAAADKEILRLETDIAKNRALLSTQSAVTGGGFSGQTARVSKEADAIGKANDQLRAQKLIIAEATAENAKNLTERRKAEKEIANLTKYTNDLVIEGASITDLANAKDIKDKQERVRITKELGNSIKDIYKAETDRGNLVGLEGLFKTNQATQNRYTEMIGKVKEAEKDFTEYYKNQVKLRALTNEQANASIAEVTKQAAEEQKQIEAGLQNELIANTKVYITERDRLLSEAEARAGRVQVQSRERDLAADKAYWDSRAEQLRKFGVTADQITEFRKSSEAQINAKWDTKVAEATFEYQRRINETTSQLLLRRLNKDTQEKIRAAQGDAQKLLEIERNYQNQVNSIRSRDKSMKTELAFDGSALSVPMAAINTQIEELKQKFEAGLIPSVESFRQQISSLEVQRQELQLWQSTIDGISNSFGSFATDAIFDTENAVKNLGKAFQNVAKGIISELVKIAVRYSINQAIGTASMSATAAASSATAATVASAWATAAALVSAATFGASAAAGGVALGVLVASTKALAGFSTGGYTGNKGRREIAGVVHGQEYVVNARATKENLPLLKAINSGMDISSALPSSGKNINFGSVRENVNQAITVHVVGEISGDVIKLANDQGNRNFNRYYGK